MKAVLIFNSEPFSVNRMYYHKDGKAIRRQEARNWAYAIFEQLLSPYNASQISKFKDHFKSSSMAIKLSLTVFYQKSKLFNKGGSISSQSMDCSNFEKPLIDLMFDKRYSTRKPPEGAPNLELDDKYILELNSHKRVSLTGKTYMVVELEALDLEVFDVEETEAISV